MGPAELVSQAALVCVFYGLLTPAGLLLRLFRRDALSLRARDNAESYWAPISPRPERRSYFRQY